MKDAQFDYCLCDIRKKNLMGKSNFVAASLSPTRSAPDSMKVALALVIKLHPDLIVTDAHRETMIAALKATPHRVVPRKDEWSVMKHAHRKMAEANKRARESA